MAIIKLGIGVGLVDPDTLPIGTTVSKAPEESVEAISFQLVPKTEPEPVYYPPPLPPEKIIEYVEKPVIIEKEVLVEAPVSVIPTPEIPAPPPGAALKEVPYYVGTPENVAQGDYMGVVWAVSTKEAGEISASIWGDEAENYIINLYEKGPRPYMIIKPPKILNVQSNTTMYQEEPSLLTIPEALPKTTKTIKCLNCLAEFTIPKDMEEARCPICFTPVP